MFLEGKFAQPVVPEKESELQVFDLPLSAQRVLMHAPGGYLSGASLAARLQRNNEPVAWLRTTAQDADPATLLLALIGAWRSLDEDLGSECLGRIQQLQWLEQGWPDLYGGLAAAIKRADPGPATLVMMNCDALQQHTPTQLLFYQHFLPGLPNNIRVVLTAERQPPLHHLATDTTQLSEEDLRLDMAACQKFCQQAQVKIDVDTQRRLLRLTAGRYPLLQDILAYTRIMGRSWLEENLRLSRSLEGFLSRVVNQAVQALPFAARPALSLLVYLGYNHALIHAAATDQSQLPDFPAVQHLCGGWQRLPRLWREAFGRAGALRADVHQPELIRAAEYLCRQQAVLSGIDLLLAADAHDEAAQHLESNLQELLYAGQWRNFDALVSRLERTYLKAHPGLLNAQGFIKGSQGQIQPAVRLLEHGSRYALENQQFDRACESLMALASLAEMDEDLNQAVQYAVRARELARKAGLPAQQAWAEYHLGGLLIRSESYPEAVDYFENAQQLAEMAGDEVLQNCIQEIRPLAARQVELVKQSLQRRQAFRRALTEERQHAQQMQQALSPTGFDLPTLAADRQKLPLAMMMRFAGRAERTREVEATGWRGVWQRLSVRWRKLSKKLLKFFRNDRFPERRGEQASASISTPHIPVILDQPEPTPEYGLREIDPPAVISPSVIPLTEEGDPQPPPAIPVTGEAEAAQTVAVYFLGNFRLGVDDQLLEDVPGGQVGSLLKYLLYHRQRRIPREELIDLFWPEADPDLARNRLNVAVSHVRQVFRPHVAGEVVVYQEGKYTLTSELDFWTDLSEFEQNLEEAWRDTQAGKPESAVRCLEVAANLYQGDFLADDRYEEWTIFTRERVRLAYLDALVQLAHHYFNSRQYAACAALCQSILERDPCREDIHCLLMRCYARQDQFHLGLRQYQTCVEVLDRELEIEPAEATQSLYRRLQRREHTRPGMA